MTNARYSVSNPRLNPPAPFKKGGNQDKIQGEMSIESGNCKITFTNVLVGEVWLCSGQSNMEFPLEEAYEAEKYISKTHNSKIRFFQTDRHNFKPYECDNCLGKWKIADSNSVKKLTAVGYFFALNLIKKLNVPIGLIEADYGGTRIEAWLNYTDLEEWDNYKHELSLFKYARNQQKYE